jgi:hypothetical protein
MHSFIVALSRAGTLIGYYFWLSFIFIGCLAGLSDQVVTCEGELLSLSLAKPFAFSKPQVTGDVSPGPYLPKQKEPSH